MVEDAAKRLADEYALHRLADPLGNIGRWFAVRLHDGTSGDAHTLYATKAEAVRGQHHDEDYYAFVQVIPGNMTVTDAQTYLNLHRRMYDKGLRLADRDTGGRDMIRRLSQEDQYNQLRALFIGDRAPSNIIY